MAKIPLMIRRFLRFRLRTLLLLPVLFAAGWWWATWPERTARRFVELLTAGDIEAATAMSDLPQPFEAFWAFAKSGRFEFDRPILAKVLWRETISGRRLFIIPWRSTRSSGDLRTFAAACGRVSLSAANEGNLSITHSIQILPAQKLANILSVVNGFAMGNNRHIAASATDNSVVVTLPDQQQEQTRYVIEELEKASSAVVSPTSIRHVPFNRTEYLKEMSIRIDRQRYGEGLQPSGPLPADPHELQRRRPL
jgi:hypothetical protein